MLCLKGVKKAKRGGSCCKKGGGMPDKCNENETRPGCKNTILGKFQKDDGGGGGMKL